MYKIYIIILTIIMIFSIGVSIYADEISSDPAFFDSDEDEDNHTSTTEYIEIPSSSPILDENEITNFNVVRSVNPITPSNTSGLKSALLTVLGNYDAVIVEYQYQSSNGYYSYLREIQPDYVWIFSAVLLIIVIFCLFRFLGGIFSGRC